MAVDELLDPSVFPSYLAAGLMLLLAAWLLWLDFGRRANRAFAVLLLIRAANIGLAAVALVTLADLDGGRLWWYLAPYFMLATPFALLYFVSVYPKPRGWIGRSRYGALAVFMAGMVVQVLYAMDHTLYATLGVNTVDGGEELGVVAGGWGPLTVVWGLVVLGYGLASLVFAWDYVRMRPGTQRRSIFILLLAFALQATYDAMGELLRVSPNAAVQYGTWINVTHWLVLASLVPVAMALGLLVSHAFRRKDVEVRRSAVGLGLSLLLPLASSFYLVSVVGGQPSWTVWQAVVLLGLWRLTLPLLVTYSLVRHQLFDLDAQVKSTLRRVVIALPYLGAFVASESLESVLPFNSLVVAIVAAGLITLALHPIKLFAARLADAAMPGVKKVAEFQGDERTEFYLDQARVIWADGKISPKERLILDNLRAKLGIDAKRAKRLESMVLGELGLAPAAGSARAAQA